MWQPLTMINQLSIGSLLRTILLDGPFQLESIQQVQHIANYYVVTYIIKQNGIDIPIENQPMLCTLNEAILINGFEVWTE